MTTTTRRHTDTSFDAELRSLKAQILAMGHLVDEHVDSALRALMEQDVALADKVIEADRAVNQMEIAIDEQCIRLLALHQPAASDLRFVAAALKMVTDLERIGDLAVNMAERARALAAQPPLRAVEELPGMAAAAQGMLRKVLDSFVKADAAEAEAVMAADVTIDAWMARLFTEISGEMERDSKNVARGLATIFFAKHVERMADHVTNVAEMVVYLVRGKDVRHARTSGG
jgi:phosphate transport system protein